MNQCPNCNGRNLVSGKITSKEGAWFAPAGQRFWSKLLLGGTQFTGEALACLDCGQVWGFTSAPELRKFVQKHCTHKLNEPASSEGQSEGQNEVFPQPGTERAQKSGETSFRPPPPLGPEAGGATSGTPNSEP